MVKTVALLKRGYHVMCKDYKLMRY